jgi:hypothetical protein
MLMVQEAPAAILVPQVFDGEAKSVSAAPGEPPVTVTLVNAIAALLLFVSVTVCAGVVVPTSRGPNVKLVGDTASVGRNVSSATNASDGPFSADWKAPGFGATGKVLAEENV